MFYRHNAIFTQLRFFVLRRSRPTIQYVTLNHNFVLAPLVFILACAVIVLGITTSLANKLLPYDSALCSFPAIGHEPFSPD